MAERKPLVALLAAGRATRFGGGKLDARYGDRPLGQWVLDAVATTELPPGVIVVGPQAPAFAEAASGWRLLTNPAPEEGLAGSVALAASEAMAQQRDLLLLLADMPLVEPGHLRRLVEAGGSVATAYPDGRLGVPAMLVHADLPLLANLTGDRGAGQVLTAIPGISAIAAPPVSLIDIDTPQALDALNARLSGSP